MVQIADIVLILIWLPQIIYQLLVFLYWLQDKEYRWDRFADFLNSADSAHKLNLLHIALKLAAIVIFASLNNFYIGIFTVFLIIDFGVLLAVMGEGIRRPVFTTRARRVLYTPIILLTVILLLAFKGYMTAATTLLLGEMFAIFGLGVGVYWTSLLVNKAKIREKAIAQAMLAKLKPLVIGVTGSYGKTTTKDFIYTLLTQNAKSLKTLENQNTDFGIIRRIINSLTSGTRYFVVEMGAYRRGEIKKLSDLAKPRIGIITGIEAQHLALFGSLQNILEAKFELIEALPHGGIAIFNLTNSYCKALFIKARSLKTHLQVYAYAPYKKGVRLSEDCMYFHVARETEAGIDFNIFWQGQRQALSVPIHGKHFLENVTGALLVAKLLGMSWSQIRVALSKLRLPEGVMQISHLRRGITLIDDSHNLSPTSFLSAINYLGVYHKRKIVLSPGVIELGRETLTTHQMIGKAARGKVNTVILTAQEPYRAFKNGFLGGQLYFADKPKKVITLLANIFKAGNCVLLLEGRQHKMVYDYIKSLKL